MTDDAPALQQPAQPLTGREPVLVTAENKPQVDAWRAYLAGNRDALVNMMNTSQQVVWLRWNEVIWEKALMRPVTRLGPRFYASYSRARLRAAYIILTRGAA